LIFPEKLPAQIFSLQPSAELQPATFFPACKISLHFLAAAAKFSVTSACCALYSRIPIQNMGLFDYLRTQFIEIIQWEDDSRDTLSWRFPDQDKEIKRGAQLIVRESQAAQFVYLGQFGDTFAPGKHTLATDNIPILSTLKGWKYGFESPFKADVYFVNTRLFTGNKWGTANPVMLRDSDFGIVRARAYGTYDFKIVDVKTFLKEVAGTDAHFRLDEFADTMRSRIVSVFTDALASAKVPVLDVSARYSELGDALLPLINPIISVRYGLQITSFIVENVSVPAEVEAAIDKRSSMAAIGNLNDYVKLQMAEGLAKGTGGGPAGAAAEIAVGFGMAQQMMNQPGGILSPQGTPAVGGAPMPIGMPSQSASANPDLLSPTEAAKILGVSEADVLATLTDGSLKGKKIGSTWRITRSALDDFLKS
jgi:excisionase family DNA binding protein